MTHPRDRYITIYGRKPVLEALESPELSMGRLLVSNKAHGSIIERIIDKAAERDVFLERCTPREVSRISRNGRQDQGVALDVIAERMMALDDWLAAPRSDGQLFLLDGVTTPSNVGMLLRSAVAADLAGIILPRKGCPKIDALVIKASAGTAFRAPILKTPDAESAARQLSEHGIPIIGLRMESAVDLYSFQPPEQAAWVLGNEATGVSRPVAQYITRWVRIPMPGPAESLNVAVAGSVVAFDLVRRQGE